MIDWSKIALELHPQTAPDEMNWKGPPVGLEAKPHCTSTCTIKIYKLKKCISLFVQCVGRKSIKYKKFPSNFIVGPSQLQNETYHKFTHLISYTWCILS